MKPAYVADLAADQTVTTFFLVTEKEVRSTQNGKLYLRLELGDRTGTVEARMWDHFEDSAAMISRDDFVKIQGRVEIYRGKKQVMLDRLRKAETTEVDQEDFYACTAEDVDQLWVRLRELADSVRDPWLHQLLAAILD